MVTLITTFAAAADGVHLVQEAQAIEVRLNDRIRGTQVRIVRPARLPMSGNCRV